MGKVIMSGIVPRLVEPVSYRANFADNDWATIIDAVQKNKVPDTWAVGDQKAMTINGTSYLIDIIGKNHDTYADGSGTAPLTFQMHDCYGTLYAMNSTASNTTGWTSCAMRKTHLPAILATMPGEVQSAIKEVNKLSKASGYSTTTINTTSEKLFLLAEIEVHGKTSYSQAGEGTQYDYYKAGNSIAKINTSQYWWNRSPARQSDERFCAVNYTGGGGTYLVRPNANEALGVAFAFCF